MSTYIEKILNHSDPRLKRHIRHDSRSLSFTHDTQGLTIGPVEHTFNGPILDQKQTGKCTAEDALDLLKCGPYYSPTTVQAYTKAFGSFDDAGTDVFYNLEENIDGDGPFPPNDNGSSGLTSATVMRDAGVIPGWTQTFNATDFLKALTQYPIGCGSYWYKSMFTPDKDGRVVISPSSGIAGGHQYACVGYDGTKWLKFVNSWSDTWGADGFFYAPAQTWFTNCLMRGGDATIFALPSGPAPVPAATPFDKAATVLDPWATELHTGGNAKAAKTWQTYARSVRS